MSHPRTPLMAPTNWEDQNLKESEIQRNIRKTLQEQFGGFWFKTHGSAYQMAGLPDLLGCVDGTFVGIEVKRLRHDASDLQLDVLKRIRHAGGIAFVAWSVNSAIRKLKRHLISHGQIIKDEVMEFPENSSETRSKQKEIRFILGHGDGQDSHYAINTGPVVAKKRTKARSRRLPKKRG